YASKLQDIIANVSATLDSSEGPYSQEREVKNLLIVPVTSNRGLCGGFNSGVIKAVNALMEENKGANISLFTIGKKSQQAYKRTDLVSAEDIEIWNDLTFANASDIADQLMAEFLEGKWDRIVLVYNRFKNAASQDVIAEQFLPIAGSEENTSDSSNAGEYLYEPGKGEILDILIPKSLKTQVFKVLLDSNASEHGARMTAMHKATDNAKELKDGLTLDYNKARQAAITNEILEIVGGAEALAS
ncbi:MAG: ATP synthase F1 subunit gamma, partial [Schleiferiaceae bacterium]|nr:ATP synthase F1 subunit gamma [Schleiferiaceae bacterium]